MSDTPRLTPRLGRIRDGGAANGKRFTRKVLQRAARLAKPKTKRPGAKPIRIRGAAAARVSSMRTPRFFARQMRRVVVQVHIARAAKSGGTGAFKAHAKYLQRDGVDRGGREGHLYGPEQDRVDDRDFLKRSDMDRHQFRIMVSPEDGTELGDLKPHVREFMTGVEKDLGTKLDWVAVDHHNTGQPHTHIVVRGRAEDGSDLVIDRDYLTKGLRQRASELVTDRLGHRRELDILRAEARDVTAERLTKLDRGIGAAQIGEQVQLGAGTTPRERFERTLQVKRLRHLETLRLAQRLDSDAWSLRSDWSETLKAMGRRGDIVRTLQARFADRDLANRFSLYQAKSSKPLTGRVLGTVPHDELRGTRLLVVDGIDGRSWGVELAAGGDLEVPARGTIVEITPRPARARSSDKTIARVATLQNGLWSEDRHAAIDPGSSPEYRLAHKRRLEALRRAGIVQRLSNGDWKIGEDYLEQAAAHEARTGPARIMERTGKSLDSMSTANALTWLDDLDTSELGETGFGGEARRALETRTAWLREHGHLGPNEDRLTPDAKASLSRAELSAMAGREAHASGREAVTLHKGQRFEGTLERRLDTHQGPMALVGNRKQFALIKWRSGMGTALGREIALTRKGPSIDWTLGRKRGLSR